VTGESVNGSRVTWSPTAAARRAALVPALLVGFGVALGRADLVLPALPMVLATVISLAHPPTGDAPRAVAVVPSLTEQGRAVGVRTHVCAPAGVDVVTVLVPHGDGVPPGAVVCLSPARGEPAQDLVAQDLVSRDLVSTVRPAGWGRVVLARPDLLAVAADGLLAAGPTAGVQVSCTVLPGVDFTPAAALPPRPAGLVGTHRTRRPGDGSDLLDVRPFQPGDRLRRIDWRVSARRGDLHVRRTAVDADADVVLCLDSRVDVTRDGASWSSPTTLPGGAHAAGGSSLGIAVRTAASLAAAHLRAGDRVALIDLVHPHRGVRSGSGRRQLLRIRHHLALTRAAPGAPVAVRPSALPTGAVVLVLSTFLDDVVADLAVGLRRRGARVLALDVLPVPVVLDRAKPWRAQAQQTLLTERAMRLHALAVAGVDVLPADPMTLPIRVRRLQLAQRGRRGGRQRHARGGAA